MDALNLYRRSRRSALLPCIAIIAVFAASNAPGQSSPTAPPSFTPAIPMAANAHPSFAVAVIRPHDPNSHHQGFHANGERFLIQDESVSSLFRFAYAIHPRQIVDAPDWLGKGRLRHRRQVRRRRRTQPPPAGDDPNAARRPIQAEVPP